MLDGSEDFILRYAFCKHLLCKQAANIPTASEEELLAQQAAEEAAEYDRLKNELQIWTVCLSVFGIASIWIMYSQVVLTSIVDGRNLCQIQLHIWHIMSATFFLVSLFTFTAPLRFSHLITNLT